MGFYSAKKPYHNLKASIASFYRKRVLFMKQLVEKFSEFEKPYGDSSYPEMNLQIPLPRWPTWKKPEIPGVWGSQLPNFEWPNQEPGTGPGSQWSQPQTTPTQHELHGCLLLDLPMVVDAGEIVPFYFTGGRYIVDGKTVSHECALLWAEGPGRVLDDYVCGPYGLSMLQVDDDAEDGAIINVYAMGSMGSECDTSCIVEGVQCPEEGVTIEYTTLTMSCGTSQTLQSSDGLRYHWKLTSGSGELSKQYGSKITIQAPWTNPGCINNATISISKSASDDAEVCDTITIAFNDWTENCDLAFLLCCGLTGERWCFGYYNCEGAWIEYSDCPEYEGLGCHDPDLCGNQDKYVDMWDWDSCGGEGAIGDERSAAMLAGGCCPEELI